MAQGGILGYVKAAYSLTSPITWIEFDQVLDVTWPTESGEKVDITTHRAGLRRKRYMPGLIEVGDASILLLADFNPVTSPDQAAMREANRTGVDVWFRLEVATNRENTEFMGFEFLGGVLSISPSLGIGARQEVKIDLTFSGEDIYEDAAVGASQIS